MQNSPVKNTILGLLLVLLTISFGCNSGNKAGDTDAVNLFSGKDSKTWKADRETNAAGDKDKLTGDEKKERITFFANGKFTMTSPTDQAGGTWTYQPADKTLSLTFDGAGNSENFKVDDLDKNDLKLVAADGSTMSLEAE